MIYSHIELNLIVIGNIRLVLRCSLTLIIVLYAALSLADERFYRVHPELIQAALMQCPTLAPNGVSCKKLKNIARESLSMLSALEKNPQQYGLDIMQIQIILGHKENKGAEPGVSQDLALMQDNLLLRLALIRSLESP
jgi:hypothetical protein